MQLEVQNKWAVITAVFPGLFCLWPESGGGGLWKLGVGSELIKKQVDWVQQSDNRWTHN